MHVITGSRRANGTIAFFIPQRLATCIAQVLNPALPESADG
jgi:hypothetical protein